MNKQELKQELEKHHLEFIRRINTLPENEVAVSVNEKWSAAQQLDHIVKSVSPVRMAFALPALLLKILFGSANRPSRTYDVLVEKYKSKLAAGGVATGRFVPKKNIPSVKILSDSLTKLIASLSSHLDSYTEEQLDKLILPHPLLGKLTLREMLYFTIYHVQHHHQQVATQHPSQH